jgi:hypothetical protein
MGSTIASKAGRRRGEKAPARQANMWTFDAYKFAMNLETKYRISACENRT